MKISYDNILNDATLSTDSPNPNRKVENIIHPYLTKKYEAIDTSVKITAEFDELQSANHLVYGNHNIDTISIDFFDEFDILITNLVFTVYQGNRIYYFPNTIENISKIEFNFVSTGANIYIGSLFTGIFFELPRFDQGPGYSINIRDSIFESGSGQSAGNRQVNLNEYPFSFSDVNYLKMNEVDLYLKIIQRSIPHWIDPYPGLEENINYPDEKALKFPIKYVKLISSEIPTPKRYIRDWKYNLNLNYRKAR